MVYMNNTYEKILSLRTNLQTKNEKIKLIPVDFPKFGKTHQFNFQGEQYIGDIIKILGDEITFLNLDTEETWSIDLNEIYALSLVKVVK